MANNDILVGLDAATLGTLKTAYTAALLAVAQNQSYSVSGRSFTRANLSEIKETLNQINRALEVANGTVVRKTLVRHGHERHPL